MCSACGITKDGTRIDFPPTASDISESTSIDGGAVTPSTLTEESRLSHEKTRIEVSAVDAGANELAAVHELTV